MFLPCLQNLSDGFKLENERTALMLENEMTEINVPDFCILQKCQLRKYGRIDGGW